MTLRRRTFLTVGGILLGMTALISLCTSRLMLDRFRALDGDRAEDELRRVLKSVSCDLNSLQVRAADWAWREEVGPMAEALPPNASPAGRLERWTADPRLHSSLPLIAVLDASGRPIERGAWSASTRVLSAPSTELDSLLDAVAKAGPAPREREVGVGVCLVGGRALGLARTPLGPGGSGSLVLGRWLRAENALDPGAFARLRIQQATMPTALPGRELKTHTLLQESADREPESVGSWKLPALRLQRSAEVRVGRIEDGLIRAEGALPSFFGSTRLVVSAEMPARIYQAGTHAVRTVGAAVLLIGLLLGLTILLLLEHGVLRRLQRLHREMGDLSRRDAESGARIGPIAVSVQGHDEIASVAAGLNQLLAELQQTVQERESALRRMTEACNEAEAHAEARARFLADMSHEIRTPMGAILGMTGLLLESDLSADQRERVELLNQSATGLLQVLNDILDLSNIEQGRMTLERIEVRPRDLMEEIGGLLSFPAAKKGIDLAVFVAADVPEVMQGDPVRLRQILTNLAGNAVKFTEKGEIALEATAKGTDAGRRLVLTVQDTGAGIAPERLDAIFEKYTQEHASIARRYGGTGLGLAISRQLARLMGGSLTATSEVGVGSRFRLEIPLSEANGSVERPEPALTEEPLALIVTASDASARGLGSLFGAIGCRCDRGRSREEAESYWRSPAAGSVRVVLVDSALPGGDALRVAADLRGAGRRSDFLIYLLCRPGEAPAAPVLAELGLAGVVHKPARAARVAEIVASLPPEALVPAGAIEETWCDPVMAAGVAGVWPDAAGSSPNLEGYAVRVLVIGDGATERSATLRQLRMIGAAAEGIDAGEEAVRRAATEGFDLIVLDVDPPGLSGLETAAAIRGREPDPEARVPIVALAGTPDHVRFDQCREAGIDDCLTRPLQPDDLIRVVGHCVAVRKEERVPLENSTGPLDLARLEEISGGDEGFEQSLMEEFLANVPRLIEQAAQAVQASDLTGGQRYAHTLKGSAAMVGAVPLSTTALEMEEAFHRGDLAQAGALVGRARQELIELSVFVGRHFSERAA